MRKYSFALVALLAAPLVAQELKPMQLPKPQMQGGMPLMQALKQRQSAREFSPEKLPPQTLSNLLWAAWGINREDGRRTAPSANNRQDIDVYVALPEGVFLYDAKSHALQPVVAGDLRGLTGVQPFVKDAALDLVYVSDTAKLANVSEEQKNLYMGAHTGFIGQNVYLFCASEGLATVVRAMIDKPALAKAMKLRPEQRIVLSQTVGYPKKK
jgi:SagB-type dehydrogenase family enzyme